MDATSLPPSLHDRPRRRLSPFGFGMPPQHSTAEHSTTQRPRCLNFLPRCCGSFFLASCRPLGRQTYRASGDTFLEARDANEFRSLLFLFVSWSHDRIAPLWLWVSASVRLPCVTWRQICGIPTPGETCLRTFFLVFRSCLDD